MQQQNLRFQRNSRGGNSNIEHCVALFDAIHPPTVQLLFIQMKANKALNLFYFHQQWKWKLKWKSCLNINIVHTSGIFIPFFEFDGNVLVMCHMMTIKVIVGMANLGSIRESQRL